MSIIKGIIKYLFILIGLIVAVGIITLGIMYFFPSVNLFGYHFYKGNNVVQYISAYDTTSTAAGDHIIKVNGDIASNFDVLILKADGYDINVTTYETASSYAPLFQYRFTSNMKGLKKLEDAVPQVHVQTKNIELVQGEGLKKVLQFEITEPRGLFVRNNTTFDLQLPEEVLSFGKLIVQSKSGTIVVGDTYDARKFSISNADITSTSGKVILKNTNVTSTLNIKKNSGSFYVQNDISADVNIDCKDGKYSFQNLSSNVTILGKNADVQLKNVAGNVSVRMDYGLFRANTISGQLSSLSNPNTGNQNNCDLKIQKVLKTVLVNNNSGAIEIGQVSQLNDNSDLSKIDIVTKSGNTKINNCFAKDVNISSTRGKISLDNCIGSIYASTTYGNININFLEDQENVDGATSTDVNNALVNLTTKTLILETARGNSGDGSIEAKNIRSKNVNLKSNGDGKITATFASIVGNCEITSNRGSVNVVVPNVAHLLKWKASNSADIAVFNVFTSEINSANYIPSESISAGDGWMCIYGATATTPNKLNVVSKHASVKIYDITRI